MHGGHAIDDHRGGSAAGGAAAATGDRQRTDAEAALTAAFIEGFRAASDKQAFLSLAGIPAGVEREGEPCHLVEVRIDDRFIVGRLSPGFASADLVHQPLPAAMVETTAELGFHYVGRQHQVTLRLADLVPPPP